MGVKNTFFEWMFQWFLNRDESKTLRIAGSNSLKHPSGDVDFAKVEKRSVLLVLNEMSLLGADSPLQDNFLRGIRTDSENSLADFLNMFQQYLAMFRFNAILEQSNFLMQALGNKKWQSRFDLYNESFSLETLRCLFAKMFSESQISVHPFEPLRIENPAPVILGKSKLNGECLLGKNCTTLTAAMRVNVYGEKKNFPANLKFPFKIRVIFETKIHNCEPCCLGKNKLSENFWLGTKNFETLKWEKWV